jgi:hypothetical protein
MDVGLMMIFAGYGRDNIGDDFGFDALCSAEHNFFDDSAAE